MATKKVTSKKTSRAAKSENTPQVIITQWLSYAFWGWLMAALMWTAIIILLLIIKNETNSDMVPYAVASVFVLLPIAFITDWLYRRHEPAKKTGIAAVVMVIHAVIFALISIGTLIGAVFVGVGLVVTLSADTSSQVVALFSLLVAAVLYGLLFVRTLSPAKLAKLPFIYAISMLVVSVGFLVWGISGPAMETFNRKDDTRIESYLTWLRSDISNYVQDNHALPNSLSDIDASDEAKTLIEKDLVSYKKDGIDKGNPNSNIDVKTYDSPQTKRFKYQLCVEYKEASKNERSYPRYTAMNGKSGEYKSYLDTVPHDKGEVCYRLYETVY